MKGLTPLLVDLYLECLYIAYFGNLFYLLLGKLDFQLPLLCFICLKLEPFCLFCEGCFFCLFFGHFADIQSRSHVQFFATPWTAFMSFTISQSLLKFMSIESLMPSSHLILCLRLPLQPSIFPSIRLFSNESVLHIRWPKYWSFSFSLSPSNEYSGLISFRIDWFDLLAVQGTLKSLLQHHSSKV